MRRIKKCAGVLALTALVAASAGAGSASTATQRSRTKAEWQAAIAQVKERGTGCYHASYPALQWHATPCAVAPKWPLAPALSSGSATRAAPALIGNGDDYSAQVSGLISKATGSFHNVTPTITEKGKVDNEGLKVANAFSLQLNSQFFAGSPACSGSSNPANCLAWQQFVYSTQFGAVRGSGFVYMQYWLINYDAKCPTNWLTYSSDCYTSSSAEGITPLKAGQLHKVKLTGHALSGSSDRVLLTIGSGEAAYVANTDSKLDLSAFWNTAEWGVFGDGGGGEAFFKANTTLEAQTVLKATSSSAPACVNEGFTTETNNLNLTSTPALGSESSPTMASEQTNGTTGTASCAVAG